MLERIWLSANGWWSVVSSCMQSSRTSCGWSIRLLSASPVILTERSSGLWFPAFSSVSKDVERKKEEEEKIHVLLSFIDKRQKKRLSLKERRKKTTRRWSRGLWRWSSGLSHQVNDTSPGIESFWEKEEVGWTATTTRKITRQGHQRDWNFLYLYHSFVFPVHSCDMWVTHSQYFLSVSIGCSLLSLTSLIFLHVIACMSFNHSW